MTVLYSTQDVTVLCSHCDPSQFLSCCGLALMWSSVTDRAPMLFPGAEHEDKYTDLLQPGVEVAKACKAERSWEKGQEEVSCLAVWRSGKELQKVAVLWEETLHRKLCKKEECSSDSLTSFFLWKNEWIGSMHCYSGGDLFCLLYSKLLKMEIRKMKSIFQTHSISGWKETNIFTFYF